MRFFRLSIFAAAAIFLVNIIGFIDTMTNSAMGCGSGYPLCNGSFLPDFHDYHSVIEYTHRIIVGLSSILLFVVSAIAWLRYKTRTIKWLVVFAVIGILGESTLGALTVIIKLTPALLAAHLGVALISFSALVNIAYVIYQEEKRIQFSGRMPSSFSVMAWMVFIFLYSAIYFGGYVSKTGAGHVFQGFPIPTERLTDVGNFYWIDVVHRLFALFLIIMFGFVFLTARRNRGIRPDFYRLSLICLILILLQALSGALLIYTHVSLIAVLFHISIVSLLVSTLSIICIQSVIKKSEQ